MKELNRYKIKFASTITIIENLVSLPCYQDYYPYGILNNRKCEHC